jgi:glycosyltransferase involved in cell wall biosynthesis
MAMSVPVITYNVSGAAEIVVSGENGYIVEIGDTVAMVHHVNEILSSQERLETMRNNARARVEALFTFDRYIDTFLEALEIKE